ncbi:MAG: hypothetical protein ACRDYV_12085, partial [Acidimicrobiia bacterium]
MTAAILALLLLAAACASAEDTVSAPSSTTAANPSTTVSTLAAPGVDSPVPVEGCAGLGAVPEDGEVTWVSNGRLFAATGAGQTRCLLGVPVGSAPVWGAKGDRVLMAPGGARVGEETVSLALGGGTADWTRPTGTSVLVLEDGRLRKVAVGGGEAKDVSFLLRHQEAVYHPGGRFIYSVGEDSPDGLGIFLATNQGTDVRPVAQAESAQSIHGLTFSTGSLFFLAEHPLLPAGNRNHLHWRSDIPQSRLYT